MLKVGGIFACFSVLALLAVGGCSGDDSPATSRNVTHATNAFTVTFDGVTVNPGEEHTRCIVKKVGNAEAMHVGRIENTISTGSHHMIVYRTNDPEQPTPFDCVPFTNLLKNNGTVPLMISQTAQDELTLPEGVGFGFAPGQTVRLEVHYINTTSSPLEIKATSTFHAMDESQFKNEADFAFFGNTAINIPPQSQLTTDPLFLEVPAALEGAKFFAFVGHVHKLGTSVKIASTTAKDGTDTVIYDPQGFSWSEPPTVYMDPPVEVPVGGGFRFNCGFNNTTTNQVTFGESANDEMCLFYSYYYPSKGPISCAYTDKINGGYAFCCPGDPICSMLP